MEDSGLSVEAGLPDQAHQDYQVDFDPNVELEDDGLDFGLDGSYEQVEHGLAEGIPENAATPGHEDDPEDEDHGADGATADDEHVNTTDAAETAEPETGAEVPEYQDEIGYEDDDPVATDVNADLSITEAAATEVELLADSSEAHQESAKSADNTDIGLVTEGATDEPDISWNQDIDFGNLGENKDPQDESVEAAAEESADHAEHADHRDLAADKLEDEAGHVQSDANHLEMDLDEVLDDLSDSTRDFPEIEVVYNEESYSLFGTSDDDPESYFLSEAKELDSPLSQFLSALRVVISDELAPTDELVIRFDPLELEFGERSSAKFLNRSFREILDCHAALGGLPGTSTDPVIQLSVRRDSEEHFRELLARAEFLKGAPSESDDAEMSEDLDEESPVDAVGDGQVQEQSGSGVSEEYHEQSETAATSDHAEDQEELEFEEHSSYHDVALEQGQDDLVTSSAAVAQSAHAEPLQGSEHSEAEVQSEEISEDRPTDEQAWGQQGSEGDVTVSQHAEIQDISVEQTYETNEHEEGDEQAWDEQAAEGDASSLQHDDTPLELSNEQTHELNEEGDEQSWDAQAVEDVASSLQHDDIPLELSDEQVELTGQTGQQEADASREGTDLSLTHHENGEPEQNTGTNGNFPSFLPPQSLNSHPWNNLATTSGPYDECRVERLIDDNPRVSASAPGATGTSSSTPPQPAVEPSQSIQKVENWEIDYSDDEYEPTPSNRPVDEAPSTSGPRFQDTAILSFKWTQAAAVHPPSSDKSSESGDVSMTFSVDVDANNNLQDDDLILAFDDDPSLATVHEEVEEYEEYTITYDAPENPANNNEGTYEPDSADAGDDHGIENSDDAGQATTATETVSVHTSETINGDEIDYDEENADGADDSFTPADDGAEQMIEASGVDNDEIGWENDEDEYEQQPSSGDDGLDSAKVNETAQSPPSAAGKRGRTDETESLLDETDHKRRRT